MRHLSRLSSDQSHDANKPLRAGIYGRASHDPGKRGRSIKDQFIECEMDCEDKGWIIHDHYEDRDLSASRAATKARPEFERLTADARSGAIDVIVCAESSRIARDMNISMMIRNLCESTGILLSYGGRIYNMRVSADLIAFTRDSVRSEEEGEIMRERARRTARLNGRRGAPHGSPAFGYMRKHDPIDGRALGQEPHPEHSKVIIELFQRAAARQSINSLVQYLQPYLPGANRQRVRYILKNKTYIAIRVHKPKGSNEAHETPAQWDPIIDAGLFARVQAILAEPDRGGPKETAVKHLYSGIAECGVCLEQGSEDSFVYAKVRQDDGYYGYFCLRGHFRINSRLLHAYCEESLLRWLASPKAALAFKPLESDDELERATALLAAMEAQLEESRKLASTLDPATGRMRLSAGSLAALEESLLPQITARRAEVERLSLPADPILSDLVAAGPEVAARWEALTMVQQRFVLRKCMNITVNRARAQGVKHLEPGRIVLRFAGEDGFVPRKNRRRLRAV